MMRGDDETFADPLLSARASPLRGMGDNVLAGTARLPRASGPRSLVDQVVVMARGFSPGALSRAGFWRSETDADAEELPSNSPVSNTAGADRTTTPRQENDMNQPLTSQNLRHPRSMVRRLSQGEGVRPCDHPPARPGEAPLFPLHIMTPI